MKLTATLLAVFLSLAHGVTVAAEATAYLGPVAVAASKDGKTLYVANADAKQIAVVDIASRKVVRPIGVPSEKLYVCNRFDNDVSVIDLAANKEIARVPATREPLAAAITPDGKSVFVINQLPLDRADGDDVAAVVTVIDTATNGPSTIRLPNGSSGLRGVCVSPDGKYVYAVHVLARYQMPTTQLERGWMNTNAMSIIDAQAKKLVNTVLLDDVDLGAANPWGVACPADGKTICVTHAGTHEVSVIDAAAMLQKLPAMPADEKAAADVPNDLTFLVNLRRRIRLNPGPIFQASSTNGSELNGPRGLAVVGSKAYIAVYFSDALAVVDLESKPGNLVTQIALGPKPKLSPQRRGRLLFNDAALCFQHWQSCGSCHPDARADGLNWDLMNDGLGNSKNAKSMLLAHQTPPAMISGIRPNAEAGVRAGIRHIQFAVRPEEEAVAIDEYLKSIRPVPSPYLADGRLSPAAERGKTVFFDQNVGCAKCHPEPLYTDLKMHDVGSRRQYDRRSTFDTPTLVECWRTAPYMHDGQYLTIKDLFVRGKHGNKDGQADKLTEQQTNDLVEFILSL